MKNLTLPNLNNVFPTTLTVPEKRQELYLI